MANRADVYIYNGEAGNLSACHKFPDGSSGMEVVIDYKNEVMIPLQGTDVTMVVNAPVGVDIKDCPIRLKADVDLAITYSRTNSNWAFQIIPNDLPTDSPTTVNIDIGTTGQG